MSHGLATRKDFAPVIRALASGVGLGHGPGAWGAEKKLNRGIRIRIRSKRQ
jgi:hypothetical protein